jgi:phosphoribosylformylglycinamidine synthase subunit PurQ / glutaminase
MTVTRALVLRAAGINCDAETVRALEAAGAATELVHLARVLEKPAILDACSLLVLPGGFSYGDDVAAGRLFGFELRLGLARELGAFVARGGFVLGVCNGFQVLVETGLLEGPSVRERSIALAGNESGRFECRWITLRAEKSACPWLAAGDVFPAPIAHGEGRFVVRDEATLRRLESNGQIALRYVRPDGSAARGFPDNPNGSASDVAGICDPTGRVLGLMPHPERNLTPWNHPHWTRRSPRAEGEGLAFYRRLVDAAALAPV